VTAVAVLDHRPSAESLLERRIARGWRPLASPLAAGPTILGQAACAFEARDCL
jgi:hypothetical protein